MVHCYFLHFLRREYLLGRRISSQQTLVNLGSRFSCVFHAAPCFLSYFVLHQLRTVLFPPFSPPPSKPGHVFYLSSSYIFFFFLLFDSGDTPLPCSYDMRVSRTFVSFHFPLNEMEGGWGREGHTARRRSYGYCSFVPFSFTFFRKNNSMNEKTIRFFLFFSFLYGVVPVFCYACLLISTYVL